MHIAGLGARSSFQWRVSCPDSEGSGTFYLGNMHVVGCIQFKPTANRCELRISFLKVRISSANLRLTGCFWSFIYNILVRVFHSSLTQSMEQTTAQKTADFLFSHISTAENIANTGLNISYGLFCQPIICKTHISVAISASFDDYFRDFSIKTTEFEREFDIKDGEIQIEISENVFNNLLFFIHKSRILHAKISDLPPNFPVKLNTASLNWVFPGIEALYGPNLECFIEIIVTTAPCIRLKNGEMMGRTSLKCQIMVKNHLPAVIFTTNLHFLVGFEMLNWEIRAKLLSLTAKNIEICTKSTGIETERLDFMLNLGLAAGLVYVNGRILGQGVVLPRVKGVDLSAGRVQIREKCVFVGASPVYHPRK